MARPDVLAQFRLTDWELTLLGRPDGLPVPSPLGRFDAFFMADGAGLQASPSTTRRRRRARPTVTC